MCLAIPGKIQSIESQYNGLVRMAQVSFGGIMKEASLEMVPSAKEGDYVLVHVGVAISVVNEEEAKKTFTYLEQIGELEDIQEIKDQLPNPATYRDVETQDTGT
ncbi:MAG: HypC/HybG/HupF family hydrogenase formation chaperone [Bacteroidota bacterium]